MVNIEYIKEQMSLAGAEKYIGSHEISKIQRVLTEDELLVVVAKYSYAKEEGLLFITDKRWVFCNNRVDDFTFKIFAINEIESVKYHLSSPLKLAIIVAGKEQEFVFPEKGDIEIIRTVYRLQSLLNRSSKPSISKAKEGSREYCVEKLHEIKSLSNSDYQRLIGLLPTQVSSDQYIAVASVLDMKFNSVSNYESLLRLLPMQVEKEFYIAASSICKLQFSSESDYERLLKLLPKNAAKELYTATALIVPQKRYSSASDYERLLKVIFK